MGGRSQFSNPKCAFLFNRRKGLLSSCYLAVKAIEQENAGDQMCGSRGRVSVET